MKRIINVQGKWYNLLGMYGGRCYLGKITDSYNEIIKSGIIWEMQPFFYQNEKWYGKIIFKWFQFIRWCSKFYYR